MNIVLLRALMISLILVLAGCGGGGSNDNDDDYSGLDSDSDGISDLNDSDDDNDGIADIDDAFDLDPSESLDTDNDGIGNNADTDDDGDGVADVDDACPLDATETTDTDGDGICDNSDPSSGIAQPQTLSRGVITAFGSIYINGVKYDTTNTEFVNGDLDDLPNAEQELDVGDIIWVSGTVNDDGVTGVADRVVYDVDLIGTASAIDPIAATVTVLGRVVQTNLETIFGDNFNLAELSDIALGDVLNISGFDQQDGSLLATRIDKEGPDSLPQFKVEGIVSAVDVTLSTLNIGNQMIDYTAVANGFSASVNQWVEVKGSLNNAGVLIASSIELESGQGNYALSGGYFDDDLAVETEISLEGVVSEYRDGSTFSINGYSVETNAETLYVGGDDSDIALGARLSVRGQRSSDGQTLIAARAYVRAPSNLEVEGTVAAINLAASTIEVAGITVLIQSTTQLEDETGVYRMFSIEQLAIGDYVDVNGQYDGAQLVAYRLERDSSDNDLDDYIGANTIINGEIYYSDDDGYLHNEAGEYHLDSDGNYSDYQDTDDYQDQNDDDRSGIKLEGIATQVGDSSLTLYGNMISYTATTVFEVNDRVVAQATFLSAVSSAPYVSVRALRSISGSLTALKVELESERDEHLSGTSSDNDDQYASYDFTVKGAVTAIDGSGISLNNGYNLLFDASTLYESYALVSQAQFIAAVNALNNPVVEVKALRNSTGQLIVTKVELESSDSEYDDSDNDDDSYGASEREFEGYGSIDSAGVTIQGIRIVFITTTYFELYDRQVEKAVFLAAVSGSDKFEVKTRVNSAGTYEALKIELDD